MQLCRNCESWINTAQWRGNCKFYVWEKDKWSEDAIAPDCPDFMDKDTKYQVAQKGVKSGKE